MLGYNTVGQTVVDTVLFGILFYNVLFIQLDQMHLTGILTRNGQMIEFPSCSMTVLTRRMVHIHAEVDDNAGSVMFCTFAITDFSFPMYQVYILAHISYSYSFCYIRSKHIYTTRVCQDM